MKRTALLLILILLCFSLFAYNENTTLTLVLDLTSSDVIPDAGGIYVTDQNPLSSGFVEPTDDITYGKLLENEDGSSSFTAWIWWDLVRSESNTLSVMITPSAFEAADNINAENISSNLSLGSRFEDIHNTTIIFPEGNGFDITPYHVGFSGYIPFTISIDEKDVYEAKPQTTYVSNVKITVEEV